MYQLLLSKSLHYMLVVETASFTALLLQTASFQVNPYAVSTNAADQPSCKTVTVNLNLCPLRLESFYPTHSQTLVLAQQH